MVLTWLALARRVGCTNSHLSHIFSSGRKHGSIALLSRIADATGLSLEQLVRLRGKGQQRFRDSIATRAKSQPRNGKARRAA